MNDWISLVVEHGVVLVFLATLAARIGAPVPAAPFLVMAGAAAMAGQLSLLGALVAAIVANILGDGAWFLAGRKYGYRVLKVLCRISMSPDSCVRQSEAFITRWGGGSLIAAKFVPGISVVAPPMAGALGMSLLAFLGFETLAALVWAALFLGLGMLFSAQIQQVLALLSTLGMVTLVALGLVAAAYLALRFWRRHVFLRGVEMSRISVAELIELFKGGHDPVVIDVRSDVGRMVDARCIPGALAIELNQILARAKELSREREIVLYCNCPNEATAASAARLLAGAGFKRVRPLAGGLDAWAAAGHAVEAHTLVVVNA